MFNREAFSHLHRANGLIKISGEKLKLGSMGQRWDILSRYSEEKSTAFCGWKTRSRNLMEGRWYFIGRK